MKGERIQFDSGTASPFARICSALIPLWTAIGLIALWQIASALIGVDLILPTPWQAIRSLGALLQTGDFWRALGATVGRACVSFVISFSLAVLAAVIGVYSRTAKRVFDSFFAFIRSLPTMSVILLLLLWLTPSGAPMAIAAIVVCPTMYTAFAVAAAPDPDLMEVVTLYRIKRGKVFFSYLLPNMAEGLFEDGASGFALNLKLVISAEAIAQTLDSIGSLMKYAKVWLEIDDLLALTIVAIVAGAAAEGLIRLIGRRVLVWKRSS